jgi:hypothetical protein
VGVQPTVLAEPKAHSNRTTQQADNDGTRAIGAEALAPVSADHYQLERELGRGGMGRVSLAFEARLQRVVAVKELLRGGPAAEVRFAREALVTARLQHPAIVPVYEAGRWPSGQPFYAMKLLAGRPLGELLRSCPTLETRLALVKHLIPVSEAVAYAHQQRVLHRDLKPDNIIVGDFGETVVIDWGLAKIVDGSVEPAADEDDEAAPELPPDRPSARQAIAGTRAGTRMGTLGYASPEQTAGRPVDERTDVYALGATLYEVLVGTPPRVLAGFFTDGSDDEQDFPAGLPAALVAVCRRALALSRDDRHSSALAFRDDVEAALERRSAELLVHETLRKVDALETAVAGRDRLALYTLFGACRFGFEQALARYPDDEDARIGLVRAMSAMVSVEVSARDPIAARAILSGMSQPPSALVDAVVGLEREVAAERTKHEELVSLGARHDARTGRGPRLFLSTVIGASWTIAPLVAILLEPIGYPHYIFVNAMFLVGLSAIGWTMRDLVRSTAINRAILGGALALHVVQIVMYVGNMALGIPMERTDVQHLLLWSVFAAGMAPILDMRMFVPSATFAAGFVVAARHPEARRWIMSAGNLFLTLTALWAWRPGAAERPIVTLPSKPPSEPPR